MVEFKHQNDKPKELEVYSCCGTTCDRDKSWKEVEGMVDKIDKLIDRTVVMVLVLHYVGESLDVLTRVVDNDAARLRILRSSRYIDDNETDETLLRGIAKFSGAVMYER